MEYTGYLEILIPRWLGAFYGLQRGELYEVPAYTTPNWAVLVLNFCVTQKSHRQLGKVKSVTVTNQEPVSSIHTQTPPPKLYIYLGMIINPESRSFLTK